MKLVTFTKAQAPHGVGDTRLVPDDVARQLHDDGVIEGLGESWPPKASLSDSRVAVRPARPVVRPQRPSARPTLQPAE